MRKKILANHGVVFLETVFVAPVYLVILLGMFWVADNTTARAKLAELDRTYTWAMGNRHDTTSTLTSLYDDIYSMQLPSDPSNPYELTFALNPAATKPAGDIPATSVTDAWWRWTDAQVQLSRELPTFLQGLRILHDLFIESRAAVVDKKGTYVDVSTWTAATGAGYDANWLNTSWHSAADGYSLTMNAHGTPTSTTVTARVLSRNNSALVAVDRLAATYNDETWLNNIQSESMPTGAVLNFFPALQDVEAWTRKASFVSKYSE